MILNGMERKILEKLGENLLMRKEEIINFLKNETKNAEEVFYAVMKSLVDKGFVKYVYAGSACYAITRKGLRALG